MKFRITKNHVDAFCVLIGVLGMGSLYFQVLRMPLMAAMLIASILLHLRSRRETISICSLCDGSSTNNFENSV